MDSFLAQTLRIQYRRRWQDPWVWDTGTVGVGPWKLGGGNRMGSAVFTSIDASATHREEKAAACPLRSGWFVRICDRVRNTDGTPTKVHWTGQLQEPEHEHLGGVAGGGSTPSSSIKVVTWRAIGPAGMLANIDLHRVWRGCGTDSTGIRHLESLVRFGYQKRPDDENRAGKRTLYGYRTSGVHTLHNLLTALLDWHLYDIDPAGAKVARFAHWPEFQLAGLTTALEWPVRDIESGGSVFDALVSILHPRRGLFFTVEAPGLSDPASGPMKVQVQTFARTVQTIPLPGGGTQTIPAAQRQTALVANVPHRKLTWAPPPCPRLLTLHGQRDVRIVSLHWSRSGGMEVGALARKWNAADDAQAGQTEVEYGHVFRTWGIRQGWDGSCRGTTLENLPRNPVTAGSLGAPDALHGAGGATGEVTTSGSSLWPEFGIEILDQIPMPGTATNTSGDILSIKRWVDAESGVLLDKQAIPLRPSAYILRASGVWESLNVAITFPDARTIQLGSGPKDAALLRSKLANEADQLVITCAIIMPSALCVSYIPPVAADAEQLVNADRCRQIPWAERIILQRGTVIGLNPGLAPTAPTTDRTVQDDVGGLRATLQLARLNGERSAGGVYIDRAELDTSVQPGQFVINAEMPGPSGTYLDIGYVISEVAYNPAPDAEFRTQAILDTAVIDMEPIS